VIRRKREKKPEIEGRRQRRELPPELIAEAAAHPGGSVYAIDGSMVADPYGYVPPEAIMGEYLVGSDGVATGDYVHNPRYGPVQDDYERLESPDHWLGWLPGSSPGLTIRQAMERQLADHVPGSRIEWLKVIDDPAFLTGGVRSPEDSDTDTEWVKMTVRRAALAVPFALGVLTPDAHRYVLTGVFSWVAVHLDNPDQRRDRTWFEQGVSRADAAEDLKRHIYEVDNDL
jgi:hypothetical protein